MTNERFLAVIGIILAVLFFLMLSDRTTCHNADGTPCEFGGGGRGGGSGITFAR